MKKVIFGVLAMIFAIALVTCGYFLITSFSLQKYAVTEDTPCPYSWQELRSGTYRLEIDTTAYPDHRWSTECYPKNVVAVAEVSSDPGSLVFSILPLNMGQTYLSVYCEQTTPFAIRVFEIVLQINVSEDLAITIEQTDHKMYDGITTMGEDEQYPIQWWTNPSGIINLLITEEISSQWEVVDYDLNSLAVKGPFYRENSCGFEIQGKAAGTFPLTIYNSVSKALCLEITVTEELIASISTFTVDAAYTPDKSEEHHALENVVGTAVLPQQALISKYSTTDKSGTVTFLLNEQEWHWQIHTTKTVEALSRDIAAHATETKTTSESNPALTAYSFSDGVAVFWNDGIRSMALYGQRGITLTDALAVAGQIAEANNG